MEFISVRLRLAMFLRRETVTSMAIKSEISKQAISKFANGELMPSKPAILSIAETLKMPRNFFSCTYIKVHQDHYGYEIKCATGEQITIPL